ncbi:NnrU family protein [Piscinibacter sp. HJYY11]|uniref:NnrU family protein n=1 Tax=Piscinibacter sp. HJYY11 TaxID=2801333 RepID=UPI00191FFF82|nr:NnrU family protein [Piscinibacter sp. HJYY11]MBL0728008.1 NnrU family protein [Piscinibacter sp. HJYY11]
MTLLILGLVLFLGIHSVSIVAPAWRDAQAASNALGWKGVYTVVAIVGFVLIVYGYGEARLTAPLLYAPPTWMRHLSMLLLLPVFPLLLAAYLPGRIKTAAKHPMLAATKLWALAHLLANGTLADVLLFGGFLVWAVADRISLKRRVQRPTLGAPPSAANDLIAVVGGLALYGLFVWRAHAWLIGVSPFGKAL